MVIVTPLYFVGQNSINRDMSVGTLAPRPTPASDRSTRKDQTPGAKADANPKTTP